MVVGRKVKIKYVLNLLNGETKMYEGRVLDKFQSGKNSPTQYLIKTVQGKLEKLEVYRIKAIEFLD